MLFCIRMTICPVRTESYNKSTLVGACVSPSDHIKPRSAGFVLVALLFLAGSFFRSPFPFLLRDYLLLTKGDIYNIYKAQTLTNKHGETVPAMQRASSALNSDKSIVFHLSSWASHTLFAPPSVHSGVPDPQCGSRRGHCYCSSLAPHIDFLIQRPTLGMFFGLECR